MNEISMKHFPSPELKSFSAFTAGVEAMLLERYGAVADEWEAANPEEGTGEALTYLYDPGNRGRIPAFRPSEGNWKQYEGRTRMSFTGEGFFCMLFEEEPIPTLAMQMHCPEESMDLVQLLEHATEENLSLEGQRDWEARDWFESIERKTFAEREAGEGDLKKLPEHTTRDLFYRPEWGLRSYVAMHLLEEKEMLRPALKLRLSKDASLMGFLDFFYDSPQGERMIAALDAGPSAFAEHLSGGETISAGLTPFIQTRESAERRTREAFAEDTEESAGGTETETERTKP